MSSQLDRLRRLQGLRQQKRKSEAPLPPGHPPTPSNPPRTHAPAASGAPLDLEEAVAGELIENHAGVCYQVTRRYGLRELRGPRPLGALLAQSPSVLGALYPAFGLGRHSDFLEAAFIDTETTGLGGGAGVYAFMVGVGTFEQAKPKIQAKTGAPGDVGIGELSQRVNPSIPNEAAGDSADLLGAAAGLEFVVRQFFMRSPAEEGALLVAVSELLGDYAMTVTFNGRSFDLPLLRTRFQQNYWLFPAGMEEVALLAPDRPHLDLLHPARKLWRKRLKSCRLINLEEQVLGLQRSGEDVPGMLIPQLYVDYVRSGDARPLAGVFYHNCEDIVSMVSLADALSQAFGLRPSTASAASLPSVDWLALGATLERSGAEDEAEVAYRYAAENTRDAAARAEAYLALGKLLKRQLRWSEAADIWQQWLSSIPGDDPIPYIELAKYCEWQIKDLAQAEMWTGWARHNVSAAASSRQTHVIVAELDHRLARIRRKLQGGAE